MNKGDKVIKDGVEMICISVSETDPNHYCLTEYQEFDANKKLIKSGGKPVV